MNDVLTLRVCIDVDDIEKGIAFFRDGLGVPPADERSRLRRAR